MVNQSNPYQPGYQGMCMRAFDRLPDWARALCRKYDVAVQDYEMLLIIGEDAAKKQCEKFYGDVI